jgi:hypothetical protein
MSENLKYISVRENHKELSAKGGRNRKGVGNFKTIMKLCLAKIDEQEGGEGHWAAPLVRRLIVAGVKENNFKALVEILNRLEGRPPLIQNQFNAAGVVQVTRMPSVQVGGQDLEYQIGSKEEDTEASWRKQVEEQGYKIVDVDGDISDEETSDTEEEAETV